MNINDLENSAASRNFGKFGAMVDRGRRPSGEHWAMTKFNENALFDELISLYLYASDFEIWASEVKIMQTA